MARLSEDARPFVSKKETIIYATVAQLGEPPKRRRWRMQRGGEVKKQGESRSASSERGDYVSEGRAAHTAVEKRISFYATVAQLVEQRIRNAQAVGSSPTSSSMKDLLRQVFCFYPQAYYKNDEPGRKSGRALRCKMVYSRGGYQFILRRG